MKLFADRNKSDDTMNRTLCFKGTKSMQKSFRDNRSNVLSKKVITKETIQGKWVKLYDNYYIWNLLRNGIRWYGYYDKDVFCFYYVIEEKSKIPSDKYSNYEKNEKKIFSNKEDNIEWLNDEVKEDDAINKINSNPGFGLELELNDSNLSITTKKPMEECEIKGHSMKKIANGSVDVTFDTRTGYNGQKANQNLVIELVFDGSKTIIKKDEDFLKLQESLIKDLQELKLEDLQEFIDKKESTQELVSIKQTNSTENKCVFSALTNLTFNIHITLAMSLESIGKIMIGGEVDKLFPYSISTDDYICFQKKYSELSDPQKSDQQRLILFQELSSNSKKLDEIEAEALAFCEIFKKAFQKDASMDPKQNMEVMNRTSFGKMFSLLSKKSKEQVIFFINDTMDGKSEYSSENHKITVNDMLQYFKLLLNGNEMLPSMDPTYHANRDRNAEKMGISQLGNKTEKDLSGKECPIFEIRSISDNIKLKKIDELNQMMTSIISKLWPSGSKRD